MSAERNRVVIIGAGIAGLSAAHYLRRRGADVEIIERDGVAGGSVRTALKEDRYLIELGPNAFFASAGPISRLARELSIEDQIVGSEGLSRKRYIRRGGRLHALPMGPFSFLLSGLLSLRGKARLLAEPLVRSRSHPSETLASFASRRGGSEILDALVDPFVSGVWAGDPNQLEAESVLPRLVEVERECGSILRGMKKIASRRAEADAGWQGAALSSARRGLFSFRWGMGTITARIEEELKSRILLGAQAESLERLKDGRFAVCLKGRHPPIEADAVVVAAPAYQAAQLLIRLDREIYQPLASIPYSPLAVVHTAFESGDIPIPLDGFGVLIPRSEGVRLLGSIWSSAMFPGRCPKGEALLTNFIGGATDTGLVDLSDDEILNEVLSGLDAVMGIGAKPKFVYLKRWAQAIPQYTIGHRARIGLIRSRLDGLPGVFLAGSYLAGVSVSDTIAHARGEVDRVMAFLK